MRHIGDDHWDEMEVRDNRCTRLEQAPPGGFGTAGRVPDEDPSAAFEVGEHQGRSQSTVTQEQHLTPDAYATG